jgi:hypothetical protein
MFNGGYAAMGSVISVLSISLLLFLFVKNEKSESSFKIKLVIRSVLFLLSIAVFALIFIPTIIIFALTFAFRF